MTSTPELGLQLQSTVKKEGVLELALVRVPTPAPQDDQVVVRIEASPINPSDLGLLLAGANLSTLTAAGSGDAVTVTARIAKEAMPFFAGRIDQPMPVGNEGAGVVVAAGSSQAAQALMGKT